MRWIQGHLAAHEVRPYLITKSTLFWGLILACFVVYPAENRFSIMTHTFSFLGRWEDYHNPNGWWLFSVAMFLWGLLQIPLVLYAHRRLRPAAPWATPVATGLLLLGSVSISLVGIFPDVRGTVIGAIEFRDLHTWAAILVFVGYYLGTVGYGLIIARDRIRHGRGASPAGLAHGAFALPYALWLSIVTAAGINQGTWAFKYARMRAEAEATGTAIRSSWGESINTIYSFPLWENIVIYALFAFWVWFMLALPRQAATPSG